MTDIAAMSLKDLAAAIKRRKVSSLEVTKALLTRIDQWQPALNAFARIEADDALKSAKALQKVRVSASNFSPSAQQMLKDGELVCTSIQQIVSQGRAAVRVALEAAAKRPIAEKSIAMPAVAVTRDTVSSVDLSGVVAPATYRP